MKITNVRAVQPVAENSPADWRTSIGQILVAIDTDAGITGYGVGGGGAAGVHVVRTVLRDVLLDRNPDLIGNHWPDMYRATLPFGQKGIAIMAISGVDLALWDIKGRAEELPLAELLGGSAETSIPTYVTVWDTVSPEQAASNRAFKLHVKATGTPDMVAESVAGSVSLARSAVGTDAKLMIDAWMRWNVETTLAVANAVESFGVDWIEEPLPADDFAGYRQLVESSRIPIAGGEHEFTANGFRHIVEQRLHHVLQPDVCWCGGLTELIKIYKLAKAAGLRVCPHRGAEVWSLHAIASIDPQPLAESGRPWMTWVGGQPEIENGFITLTNRPGFGVIIDEDNLPIAGA